MRFVFTLLVCLCSLNLLQAQDTLKTKRGVVEGEVVNTNGPRKIYDPKIASKRSAIIPGWGQIYNDSWWKVPIIYGGFGVAIYYIGFNNEQYNFFLDLYTEEFAKSNSSSDLLRRYSSQADNWRKNRDLVILTTVGIYALQILEATIDAHLKGFNVDEELAFNMKPKIGVINNGAAYIGMGITLPIGR